MGDHEGFLAFSLDTSGAFQTPGNRRNQNNYYNKRNFNRSRQGFWSQQQHHNNSNNYQRDRHNNSGHRTNKSFADKKNEQYNVLDYVHPSMVEDPWAQLISFNQKRDLKDRQEDECPEAMSLEKKMKIDQSNEDSTNEELPEDKTEPPQTMNEKQVEDLEQEAGTTNDVEPSDSPEGLKIYD